MIGLLAVVVIRLSGYGGEASVDGGDLKIRAFSPGWEGIPRGVYRVERDWRQDGEAVSCVYRVIFERQFDLQCLGLEWSMNAEPTVGRTWRADDKARVIPCRLDGSGFGSGTAQRFTLPLPEGRTLIGEFPEPVAYAAQDGRKWGPTWSIRFGSELDRKVHPAGKEIVYRLRFTSPEGVRLERPEPYVVTVGDAWAPLANRKDVLSGSALDFSAMGLQDAPAGKYGWLKSVGGTFEFVNRPGVAQRFYGVNLCFSANYPTHEETDRLVVRLARLGYNALRIHHHDDWWAKHPEDREKLDYLIARAIASGLYITTDLYVSRMVTWRELGEDRPGGPNAQLFKSRVEVCEAAFANWAAFAKEFLEHVNPYTQRAYKDEPGMPFISLINEGNLGMGFGYSGKADDSKLLAAWRAFSGDAQAKSVPSPWSDERAKAFDLDLERRFTAKAIPYLRGLGVKALLTNDNNGDRHGEGEGATELYDYVDNHFYIDHPVFLETPWQLPSKCPNENPVKLDQPKLFKKGYARTASKPYAITEWNFSGPGRYRALGGILTGAYAARDGWDALWRFAYAHDRRMFADGTDQTPDYFDCSMDPLSQASDRASICLFLRGDANEGVVTTDVKTGSMSFVSPRTCGGFVETGRLTAGPLSADISGAPASLWASSLDGRPLNDSRRILLVHLTDVQGNGARYADATRRILLAWGKGCLVEKGWARVQLNHPGDLRVWKLDTTGRRFGSVPVTREGHGLAFDCATEGGTLYYELENQ